MSNLFVTSSLVSSVESSAESSSSSSNAASATEIDWEAVLNTVIDWCMTTGIKILIALLVMIISFSIINAVFKRIYKRLKKKGFDETINRVLYNFLRICSKLIVIVCLVGYVGIETASISALIASLGVGISLAVQGTLSNFAGGVIIIIMRPFKLGDFITSNGQSGTVEDIRLFYTSIVTPDNKVVLIPNGSLANNVIVNVSTKATRRVDVTMPVSYDSDIEKCKKVISEVCNKNEKILKNPAVFIEIGEYQDSSISIYVRAWCNNADYWDVNFYLLDEIRKAFNENDIVIPFNQLDVNITTSDKKDKIF